MNVKRSKIVYSMVLTLMMAATILFVNAPQTNAATQNNTYIYIVATPNPIGVNQQVNLQFFMANVPPAQYPLDRPRFGYWYNLTITVTKPDGSIEKITGLNTGEAAAGYTLYTPNQVGTYKFVVSFPGQTITTGARTGDYYKPSTSPIAELTVQNEPIQTIPEYPLPTDYWRTPIEGQNRAWNVLSGNWLGGEAVNASGNGYNPYTTAPNTAHILWNRQQTFGGLVGGSYDGAIYNQGRWPAGTGGYFGPPIIISGVLYVNEARYFDVNPTGFKAIDLFTGETLWTNNIADSINIGQIYRFSSTMTAMVSPYLWSTSGTTWRVYDAFTGSQILNVTNVLSGGRITVGPSGELLIYHLGGRNNWLSMWNSTLFFYSTMLASTYGPQYAPNNIWAPRPGSYNWAAGLQWNVTTPNVGNQAFTNGVLSNDVIITQTTFAPTDNQPETNRQHIAYSIKPGTYTGNGSGQQAQVLWGPVNRTTAYDGGSYERIEAIGEGIYVIYHREELKIYAYDAYTGRNMWTSDPYDSAFGMFTGEVQNFVIANGKVYSGGYDGCIYAHDVETGQRIWKWYAGSSGFETPYESWPVEGSYVTFRIADGKIFAAAMEHSPSFNTWRLGKVWCVNETNGELVWSVLGSKLETTPSAVAYGMFVYMNQYDGKIYCFGKGDTKLIISAPQTMLSQGTGAMITGTVTDQSPGAKDTPAIADESMSAWMEYLYMQKPKPTNATGVQITLTAIDENNNTHNIGTTISDTNGNFGITWIPPAQGTYKITATFSGSESYWPSDTTTYIGVGATQTTNPNPTQTPATTQTPSTTTTPATTSTASPTAAPQPTGGFPTETLLIISAAVVIIAIVVAAAVLLRKRA